MSFEYEDDVDVTVVTWILHCSWNNNLGKIADSDVNLMKGDSRYMKKKYFQELANTLFSPFVAN